MFVRPRALLALLGLISLSLPVMVATAPAAHAAPTCTGNIQVTDTDNNTAMGFVSKDWNTFGEFVTTTTPSEYLSVSVTSGSEQNITDLNGPSASFPLFGGIVGFSTTSSNLGTGNPNYTYIGGTTATAPGATPQTGANAFTNNTGVAEQIESAIWTINGSNQLAAQWINTDSSKPATHLIVSTAQGNEVLLTGDPVAFGNSFGGYADVALTFVPTSSCDNDLALSGVPSNITTASTSHSGAIVTYTAPTATDEEGGATVACTPPSGSTFAIGTTTVTCTATDADDLNSPVTATFTVTVTDNDLALTGVPANITTAATNSSGAVVTYTPPTAADEESGATVMCDHASGSTFPVGTTTVTCFATDADDTNSPVEGQFTVTVTDHDLALHGVPANITTAATSSSGAVVTYTPPTATDEGGGPTVMCDHPSGSTFPVGMTTVTCTASVADDTNSPVEAQFIVTVTDTDLALTGVPANITTPSTSSSGAVVTYTPPTATDEEGGATVACTPPSGSTFPIGTTTVTCTATDADDTNSPVMATFTVTVSDNDLALTGVPANITTPSTSHSGAVVTYTPPTATDEEGGATVACTPPSGSTFPIGTTTVTCTASDADDLNSPVMATFTVTVTDNDLALSGVPANITTVINTNGGAFVTFTPPTAADEEPGATVVCNPPSGSFFAVGTTTTVTCTATDADDLNSPVSASFTVTVTKASTMTTVTASPSSPMLGTPVTFTATVAATPANPVTPTGTVSFFIDGAATPVATVPLPPNGVATFTTAGLGAGPHTVTATYSGDSNFFGSSGNTSMFTVSCTTTIVGGTHSAIIAGPGSTCIFGGTVTGAIVVPRGSLLDLEGVTVNGSISASGPAFMRICGTTSSGSVTINGATGFVLYGDAADDACAVNRDGGGLTLDNNTGGVEAIGNHVLGAINVVGNRGTGPFPEDTAPDISGNGP